MDILADLISRRKFVFKTKDLRALYGWSSIMAYQRIRAMLDKGVIKKIWRGTFMINPRLLPNVPRIAFVNSILGDKYYFGLYTAMSYWKISDIPIYTYQAITINRRFSGQKLNIAGLKVRLIYVNPQYFYGYIKAPYSGILVNMSDLEKTIVDSAYFVGRYILVQDLAKAILLSKNKIDIQKMIEYLEKLGSPFTNQRLGFLLEEIAGIKLPIGNQLRISNRYILLDPKGPKQADERNTKWRILINRKIEQYLK